jgi:hypothetical protein
MGCDIGLALDIHDQIAMAIDMGPALRPHDDSGFALLDNGRPGNLDMRL